MINRTLLITALSVIVAICLSPVLLLTAADKVNEKKDDKDQDAIVAREKAFEEQLTNVVMVGSFTIDGKSDDEPLKEESYEIDSVKKLGGKLWVFTARVKYGKVDTKLPITVPVEWAGDTPMVSLTNATLPGLGEAFSARVIFYENRYAGTWQHGSIGGHMFGRIEKKPAEKPADSETK